MDTKPGERTGEWLIKFGPAGADICEDCGYVIDHCDCVPLLIRIREWLAEVIRPSV
jgi:hypothetical protein